MEYTVIFSLFILGLIVGSFLNVVILRWNTGMNIARGRSKCFSCDKTLSWYELIPLVSFLVQKGRCRTCGSKISWQYPLVELAAGIMLPVTFATVPDFLSPFSEAVFFLLTAVLVCLYIVIFVYDLRHKIIPDFFSYSAALVALFVIALEWYSSGVPDLWRIIAGPSLFLFFYFFWFISRGKWMGLGDAKLALSIGWMLGMWQGIAAILLAFWIGAVFSLLLMLFQKFRREDGIGMKSEIPFGPFILIGFLAVFVFHVDIQTVFAALWFLAV
ncbi:MAG: prepilin peptidase [Patescibacteria group bacterium]